MGPPKTINQQNQPKMIKVNSSVNSRFWKLSFGRCNTLCMRNMILPTKSYTCHVMYDKFDGQFDTKIALTTWLSIKCVSRVSSKRIKHESC